MPAANAEGWLNFSFSVQRLFLGVVPFVTPSKLSICDKGDGEKWRNRQENALLAVLNRL